MPKELYFPSGLINPGLTPKQEVDLMYFEMFPNAEARGLNVDESMIDFCMHISGQPLNKFMSSFLKERSAPFANDFLLSPIFGARFQAVDDTFGNGKFFMDTQRGFILGTAKKEGKTPTWVGVIGIDMGEEIADYNNGTDGKGKYEGLMNFKTRLPIIAQIQGPNGEYTYWDASLSLADKKYNTAMYIFENYKWERALIALTQDWAILNGLPALYLLPASKNRWLAAKNHEEKLRMRYDVSAQRSGFTMQPNGLYGISLLGAEPIIAI